MLNKAQPCSQGSLLPNPMERERESLGMRLKKALKIVKTGYSLILFGPAVIDACRCGVPTCTPVNIMHVHFFLVVSLILWSGEVNKIK